MFEVVDGAAGVRVRAADLGDQLYRISSDASPRVEESAGALRLAAGAKTVEIVRNADVRWTLRLRGGAVNSGYGCGVRRRCVSRCDPGGSGHPGGRNVGFGRHSGVNFRAPAYLFGEEGSRKIDSC